MAWIRNFCLNPEIGKIQSWIRNKTFRIHNNDFLLLPFVKKKSQSAGPSDCYILIQSDEKRHKESHTKTFCLKQTQSNPDPNENQYSGFVSKRHVHHPHCRKLLYLRTVQWSLLFYGIELKKLPCCGLQIYDSFFKIKNSHLGPI